MIESNPIAKGTNRRQMRPKRQTSKEFECRNTFTLKKPENKNVTLCSTPLAEFRHEHRLQKDLDRGLCIDPISPRRPAFSLVSLPTCPSPPSLSPLLGVGKMTPPRIPSPFLSLALSVSRSCTLTCGARTHAFPANRNGENLEEQCCKRSVLLRYSKGVEKG